MNDIKPLRVGIACNIKTDRSSDEQAEYDEPETVEAICGALRSGGYSPFVLEASDGFPQKLEADKPDIVFNIAEGKSGRSREAQIPAILEYYGIPYVGSDTAALAIALDKALTKRIAGSYGVGTPAFAIIKKENGCIRGETHDDKCNTHDGANGEPRDDASDEFYGGMADNAYDTHAGAHYVLPGALPYPVLIKPNAEGSSKGISDTCVAANPRELRSLVRRSMRRCEGDLLAEQYVDGREFTVGILGNGPELRVFGPMELVFQRQRSEYKVYSFEIKRNYRDYIAYRCPPELPDELSARMRRDAKTVYDAIGCRDFARIDFRLSGDGRVWFIEINPLSGLAPQYSDYPMLAEFHGIQYDALVCEILRCALKRYGIQDKNRRL